MEGFKRAWKAYNQEPTENLNEFIGERMLLTNHNELKIHDHRTHYYLGRIAVALEKIEKKLKNRQDGKSR